LKAEIAVLSICLGGIAEWSHQNPRNLAYWFSQSGVHTCVYSYWKLDDRSTARVLDRFYTYLEKGVWRYEALRRAQDDIRNEARTDDEKNPIYWAGLTIIGEDGPVEMNQQKGVSNFIHYMLVIVVTLVVVFLLLRWKMNRFL
jgi:CHAT domain-containing protein